MQRSVLFNILFIPSCSHSHRMQMCTYFFAFSMNRLLVKHAILHLVFIIPVPYLLCVFSWPFYSFFFFFIDDLHVRLTHIVKDFLYFFHISFLYPQISTRLSDFISFKVLWSALLSFHQHCRPSRLVGHQGSRAYLALEVATISIG